MCSGEASVQLDRTNLPTAPLPAIYDFFENVSQMGKESNDNIVEFTLEDGQEKVIVEPTCGYTRFS